MFDALTEKLDKVLKRLRGHGVLTEQVVAEALKEIRLALLEADVNFKIVKDFIERVREKALGQEVMESLTPCPRAFHPKSHPRVRRGQETR